MEIHFMLLLTSSWCQILRDDENPSSHKRFVSTILTKIVERLAGQRPTTMNNLTMASKLCVFLLAYATLGLVESKTADSDRKLQMYSSKGKGKGVSIGEIAF